MQNCLTLFHLLIKICLIMLCRMKRSVKVSYRMSEKDSAERQRFFQSVRQSVGILDLTEADLVHVFVESLRVNPRLGQKIKKTMISIILKKMTP